MSTSNTQNKTSKVKKSDLNRILNQLKSAQKHFQGVIQNKTWIEDARKYAETQGKEIKKLISSDLSRVKAFINKEKKSLEKFQKQIPGELKKVQKYIGVQKKEFEKLLKNVNKKTASKKVKTKSKKVTTKKAARTKPSASNAQTSTTA